MQASSIQSEKVTTALSFLDAAISFKRFIKLAASIMLLLLAAKYTSNIFEVSMALSLTYVFVGYLSSTLCFVVVKASILQQMKAENYLENTNSLQVALNEREEQLFSLANKMQSNSDQITTLKQKLEEEKAAQNSLRVRWDETYYAYKSLESANKSLRNENQSYESAGELFDSRIRSLEQAKRTLENKVDALQDDNRALVNGCKVLEERNNSLTSELESALINYKSATNRANALEGQNAKLRNQLQTV